MTQKPIRSHHRSFWMLSLLLGASAVSNLDAYTYYVATSNGNDSRTPAQARVLSTPWKTIQKAATNMVAGDTCQIRVGTYRETVTVPVSGTALAPITFQAYNNEVVTISGADPIAA